MILSYPHPYRLLLTQLLDLIFVHDFSLLCPKIFYIILKDLGIMVSASLKR